MLLNIVKYMRGYVLIRVYGYSPERFLNLCSNRDILIWDLRNCGDYYEMCMSVAGFRQLLPIVRKTQTRVHIEKRYGLPFFLYKYRKRKMFFLGLGLCGLLIYVLSLFIWDIQFEGNSVRTTEVLMDFLESKKVHHGMWKGDVDCEEIETMLRSEFDDIIWASVEIKGTRLTVYVQESLKIDKKDELDDSTPTDLCADKNGTIDHIITRSGTPLVGAGSEVSEGAILVQGRMEIVGDDGAVVNYQYCAADADIYMKTAYAYEDTFPMKYKDREYVGEEQEGYYIKTFSKRWKLDFWNDEPAEDYEEVVQEYQMHLWNNFYLPFYCGTITKNYYKNVEKTYTKEEAEQIAQKKIEQFCKDLQKKGVQIVQNNVTIQVDETMCKASGTIEVIEQTGVRTPTEVLSIPQEDSNEYNGTEP